MFFRITNVMFIWFVLIAAPLFSSATFSNSSSPDSTKPNSTLGINPDEIFTQVRNFLTITPHKGTTTNLSIDININKDEIAKMTESKLQSTKDYIINYSEAVGRNIYQKIGVDVVAISMFFYNNLYTMFATTFALIKSVLP